MTDYYVSTNQVAAALDLDSSVDADLLRLSCSAATNLVDSFCGRTFDLTTSASRYFNPVDAYCVPIHDAATVTAVATDDAADGTYSTTWSASDYQAQPVGGVGPAGQTGWPYTAIVAVSGRMFTQGHNRRPIVKVTGTWGWTTVPDDVVQATLFLATEMFKAAREAPFGSAGLADFGPVTIRGNRRVNDLLQPYKTGSSSDGRFLVA